MDLQIDSLPPGIRDIYKDYKRRQKIVIDWLQQNSQSYNKSSNDGTSIESSSRVSLAELKNLTNEVTLHQVEIPHDVLYSARTMLQMRKEVRGHYKDSDNGHDLFIIKFERIVAELDRLPRSQSPQKPRVPNVTFSPGSAEKLNRFAALPPIFMQGLGKNHMPFANGSFTVISAALVDGQQASQEAVVPITPPVPTLPDDKKTHLEMEFLFQLSQAHHQARSVCAKARRGQVPVYIAAYMVERAFLLNYSTMIGIWHTICGPDTVRSTVSDVADSLRKVFTAYNKSMTDDCKTKFQHVDVDLELLEPSQQMKGLWECLEDIGIKGSVEELYSLLAKSRLPYAQILSRLTTEGTTKDYFGQLLLDLQVSYAIQQSAITAEHLMASATHMIGFVKMMHEKTALPRRLFWGSSLRLLSQSSLSFEHGNIAGVADPQLGLGKPPNCRLQALSLAQEVSQALRVYMPPEVPWLVGFSTFHNLIIFEVRIHSYLRLNRFDIVSQHPAIAGSDVLLILDTIYRFGFQQLAYENTFLGPLHIYNALRSVRVLEDEIPILETLCNKFVDAAFYGSRPCKKFSRVWKQVDDVFNYSECNHSEAKSTMFYRRTGKIDNYIRHDNEFATTERGQLFLPDSRNGYNKRMDAGDYSLLHRIYHQKKDTEVPIADKTLSEIFGTEASAFFTEKDEMTGCGEVCMMAADAAENMKKQGFLGGTEYILASLEDALVKETTDPFPLFTANLMKVWHHCYAVLSKMTAGLGLGPGIDVFPNIKYSRRLHEVLRECDMIAQENRQHVGNSKPKQYKHAQAWRKAFVEEFNGLTLEDFQWKNL